MNNSETLNTELTSTLEYLIDKFNITLNLSSEQLKAFSIQMAEKIITWKIATSIFSLVCWAILIIVILKILKILKIEKFSQLNKMYIALSENGDRGINIDKLAIKYVIKIVAMITILFFIAFITIDIKTIIECVVFPEKIILEFISQYL